MLKVQNVSVLFPHQNYLLQELANVCQCELSPRTAARRVTPGARTQRVGAGRGEAARRRSPAWSGDACQRNLLGSGDRAPVNLGLGISERLLDWSPSRRSRAARRGVCARAEGLLSSQRGPSWDNWRGVERSRSRSGRRRGAHRERPAPLGASPPSPPRGGSPRTKAAAARVAFSTRAFRSRSHPSL